MIVEKELDVWLPYIFDAFDEICRRMAVEEGSASVGTQTAA